MTNLRITGMSCNNCVRHVSEALRGVPGVTKVEVTLPDRATVEHAGAAQDLVAAVESAGYEAVTQPA